MIFEYKVKCKHKLGWKEIKLYADTDIEEFFNRNSINYVRNITDTIEHRQFKEIERLNNIINGIEEHLKSEIKIGNKVWSETQNREERMQTGLIKNTLELTLDKLQELKGENK